MAELLYIPLPHRSVLSVSGSDATEFLQGLITNDIELVTQGQSIYAALLTPQGKYLHDFLVMAAEDGYLLDCEEQRHQDLITRLSRYRLRAQVDIRETDLEVFALTGSGVAAKFALSEEPGTTANAAAGRAVVDPRSSALGARLYAPAGTGEQALQDLGFTSGELTAYNATRYAQGIAEGTPEMEPEKSYPMEYGLERLNGVSFSKGCYVGQEVTVRMKNRDLVRKCLVPVKIDGAAPAIGTQLTLDNANTGELRGVSGDEGLALIRKDLLDQAISGEKPLEADGILFHPTNLK
jgi:folate-binding protein YgfZ